MAIQMLIENQHALPALTHLFLNFRAHTVPPYGASPLDSIVHQLHLLDLISAKHLSLRVVRIGPCLWRYSVTGMGWTPMPMQQTISWWIDTFGSGKQALGKHIIAKMMMLNWGI